MNVVPLTVHVPEVAAHVLVLSTVKSPGGVITNWVLLLLKLLPIANGEETVRVMLESSYKAIWSLLFRLNVTMLSAVQVRLRVGVVSIPQSKELKKQTTNGIAVLLISQLRIEDIVIWAETEGFAPNVTFTVVKLGVVQPEREATPETATHETEETVIDGSMENRKQSPIECGTAKVNARSQLVEEWTILEAGVNVKAVVVAGIVIVMMRLVLTQLISPWDPKVTI